jgi:hypothetical protein
LNYDWSGVVNEGLASRFDIAIEEAAELIAHKIGSIQFVIVHIVFHNPKNHHTEGALILEPTFYLARRRSEIRIGTALLHFFDQIDYCLEVFLPLNRIGDLYDALKRFLTVHLSRLHPRVLRGL